MSQIVALPTAVINGTSVRNGDGPLPLSASLDELLDQARDLEGAGRFAKAADVWDEAAMLAGAAGDMTLVEQIRLAAARCKIEIGATEAAESDLAVAVASPDPSISGPAAQTLARIHVRRGDVGAAERWYRHAAVRFDELGWTLDLANVLEGLGECLGRLSRLTEALTALQDARDLYRSLGRGLEAANADDRVAAALIELGRYAEALDRLAAAARVADASGDAALIAYAQYRMGWTLVLDEQPNDALPWLQRARAKYGELGDLVGGADCDEKAAQAFSDLGEFDRAAELHEGAIAVFEAFGHDSSARIAESNLATIYSRLGRHEDAAARREDLLEKLQSRDDYVASAVTVRLAKDLLAVGQATRALMILDDVADYFMGRESVGESALFHATHARALLALDRVSSARDEAERVLNEFDRDAVPEQCAVALEVMAECERRTGTRGQADRLLAQAVALYLAVDQHDKATDLSRNLLPHREPKSRDVGSTSDYAPGCI
jgi:tetratricopeptide (TPR) repeat protein